MVQLCSTREVYPKAEYPVIVAYTIDSVLHVLIHHCKNCSTLRLKRLESLESCLSSNVCTSWIGACDDIAIGVGERIPRSWRSDVCILNSAFRCHLSLHSLLMSPSHRLL